TGRLGKAAARAIGKKRVATPDGGWETVRTLDIYHPDFDDAMLYAFRSNVARHGVRISASRGGPTVLRESANAPSSCETPIFWLVAGPNGSGKSSFYQTLDFEASARSIWIINPDLLTVRIQQVEGLELRAANLQAVKRIETWLEVSIQAHQTIGVETVLS